MAHSEQRVPPRACGYTTTTRNAAVATEIVTGPDRSGTRPLAHRARPRRPQPTRPGHVLKCLVRALEGQGQVETMFGGPVRRTFSVVVDGVTVDCSLEVR